MYYLGGQARSLLVGLLASTAVVKLLMAQAGTKRMSKQHRTCASGRLVCLGLAAAQDPAARW